MISVLLALAGAITPSAAAFSLTSLLVPAQPPTDDYSGLEYRWKRLVFRPALFINELYIFTAFGIYILAYLYGKSVNVKRATAWIKAHQELYASQFTQPTVDGTPEAPLIADGASDLYTFSTGRRGLYSLHTTFTLIPRQDPIQTIYQTLRSFVDLNYSAKDEITLDFKLRWNDATSPSGFVWAVVNKDELQTLRSARWDLSTFTKTSDSVPVDPKLQVMTEYADISDVILKAPASPKGRSSLWTALDDPRVLKHFRSLIITDEPAVRPDPAYELKVPNPNRQRHILLTFSLPKTSEARDTESLVSAVFDLVDLLYLKGGFLPETNRKLKATRKLWDETFAKEAVAEKNEEAEEAKRTAKRKAEEEKLAKLSAAEQKKLLEKERKRTIRKAQTKGARK